MQNHSMRYMREAMNEIENLCLKRDFDGILPVVVEWKEYYTKIKSKKREQSLSRQVRRERGPGV